MLWLSMGTPCAASKRCDTTPICRYSLLGLITTLLALMSAAWILMTLEVAVVATIGISWAIYVICRQVRGPIILARPAVLLREVYGAVGDVAPWEYDEAIGRADALACCWHSGQRVLSTPVYTLQARRIHDKFKLTKADTVSFDDILNSGVIPGASGRRLSTAEDDDDDEVHALIAKGGARGRGTYDV